VDLFLLDEEYKFYWFNTGTPTFLLKVIKEKGYNKKYLNEKKEIFLVGIEFDEEIQNISRFEWVKL